MEEEIRLTRGIHNFVRGHLSIEEELKLLEEIIDSNRWMGHLELDMAIYRMAKENQKRTKSVIKWY